jgi:hypothetical protein
MPLDQKPTAQLKQPESPLTPTEGPQAPISPMQIEQVLESIACYKQFGKALKRDRTMQEVGTHLAQIAELAEQAVVNEAGDWYDAHTVKRNMKEIKTYAGDFVKLAQEADAINQRMTALYDDMGRVLERYFEIPNDLVEPGAPEKTPGQNQIPNLDGTGTVDGPNKLEEDDEENPMPSPTRDQLPDPDAADKAKVDKLTVKCIQLVFQRLKQKNPEIAKKFAALPARKKIELAWKLVD